MVDNRFIQDPFEEPESRLFSSPSLGDEISPCLAIDHLLPTILLLLSRRVVRGRWCMTGCRLSGEEPNAGGSCLVAGVVTTALVLGRSVGNDGL